MKFEAFKRTAQGTGASRRMRKAGKTPAIVYGGQESALPIELDHNALWHALQKEAFHSTILEMEIAGNTSKVLLRDVQYHPYKPLVLHVDFQRVLEKSKLHFKVPLHFQGEETSEAVKIDHCVVNHVLNEIEVSCLPEDLPEFIAVDLSSLKKGVSLHASELVLPQGVSIVTHGQNDPVLVTTIYSKGAAETEETPDTNDDTEASS